MTWRTKFIQITAAAVGYGNTVYALDESGYVWVYEPQPESKPRWVRLESTRGA